MPQRRVRSAFAGAFDQAQRVLDALLSNELVERRLGRSNELISDRQRQGQLESLRARLAQGVAEGNVSATQAAAIMDAFRSGDMDFGEFEPPEPPLTAVTGTGLQPRELKGMSDFDIQTAADRAQGRPITGDELARMIGDRSAFDPGSGISRMQPVGPIPGQPEVEHQIETRREAERERATSEAAARGRAAGTPEEPPTLSPATVLSRQASALGNAIQNIFGVTEDAATRLQGALMGVISAAEQGDSEAAQAGIANLTNFQDAQGNQITMERLREAWPEIVQQANLFLRSLNTGQPGLELPPILDPTSTPPSGEVQDVQMPGEARGSGAVGRPPPPQPTGPPSAPPGLEPQPQRSDDELLQMLESMTPEQLAEELTREEIDRLEELIGQGG